MAQGYCVKCKEIREIVNPQPVEIPKRGPAIRGSCPVCGTIIYTKIPAP